MKKILGLLFLSVPCFAANPIIGYVQLSTGPSQAGGFNVTTGTLTNLVVTSSGTIQGPISVNQMMIAPSGGFSTDGLLQIGPGVGRNTRVSISTTVGENISGHGYGDYTTFQPPSTTNLGWASFEEQQASTGTTSIGHMVGFQGNGGHNGTGTCNILYGFYNAEGIGPGAGLVSNVYDHYASEVSIGAGAAGLTNHTGFYSENLTNATTNYSYYAAGGLAYFGGGTANGSRTLAQFAANIPKLFNETWGCRDCVTDPFCVSSQTVTATWASPRGKTIACQ